MLKQLMALIGLPIRTILTAVILTAGIMFFVGRGCQPDPIITQIDPIVRTVEVPVERLTERVVKEFVPVEDRAMVEKLLEANRALGVQVTNLTVALASATSSGGGPVTVTTPANGVAQPTQPATINFKDWRLSFSTDGQTASYTLSQQFAIHNTLGVNAQNVPVSLLRLYEIGPGDVRTEIPITQSTLIAAAKPGAHFYVDLGVQAGVNVRVDDDVPDNADPEILVAVPWLKRGKTSDVADSRWAFLTPAFVVTGKQKSAGILPVSVNIGTFPGIRSVFSDIWVSPYVGTSSGAQVDRVGIALTTTF